MKQVLGEQHVSELRRFFQHSAVYTLGNVIYRGASFILIPLYAHALTPAEFGLLEIITVTAAIFQGMFASGVAHSALRFYFEYDEPRDRNRVVSTALIASFAVASAGSAVLWGIAPVASRLLLSSALYVPAFRIAFVMIVLEISREISLAFVRAKEQSALFVALSVVQLVVQVGANLFTVVHLHMGVIGVLAGNLVATTVVWLILTINTVRSVGLAFDLTKLLSIVRYAYPLMFASVFATILGSADRYILKISRSLAATGVYALSMRFGMIIPILIGDPFQKSFGPFRFSIMKQPNAKEIYARILTYYVLAASIVVMGIAAFGPEIVAVVAASSFREASGILALVLVPGALTGVAYVFQTGIYIEKATSRVFLVSLVAGVSGLTANMLLIPRFGMYGAASAAVLSSGCSVALTYIVSQRLYPIDYHLGVGARIMGLTAVAVLAARLVPQDPLVLRIGLKTVIVAGQVAMGFRIAGLRVRDIRAFLKQLRARARGLVERAGMEEPTPTGNWLWLTDLDGESCRALVLRFGSDAAAVALRHHVREVVELETGGRDDMRQSAPPTLHVADGSFDIVAALLPRAQCAHEPEGDLAWARLLVECRRVLRPGGWLYVAGDTPNMERLLGFRHGRPARARLARMVHEAGFREVRSYYTRPSASNPTATVPAECAAALAYEQLDSARGFWRGMRRALIRAGLHRLLFPASLLVAQR